MKRHANLLCLGAAVALLNACAPAVNAPEPVIPIHDH
jgi:alpha-L-fucosidase